MSSMGGHASTLANTDTTRRTFAQSAKTEDNPHRATFSSRSRHYEFIMQRPPPQLFINSLPDIHLYHTIGDVIRARRRATAPPPPQVRSVPD